MLCVSGAKGDVESGVSTRLVSEFTLWMGEHKLPFLEIDDEGMESFLVGQLVCKWTCGNRHRGRLPLRGRPVTMRSAQDWKIKFPQDHLGCHVCVGNQNLSLETPWSLKHSLKTLLVLIWWNYDTEIIKMWCLPPWIQWFLVWYCLCVTCVGIYQVTLTSFTSSF